MRLWSWLFGDPLAGANPAEGSEASLDINPATGLLMVNDCVDVMGNPYGFGNPGGVEDDTLGDCNWNAFDD
jgi:hypothetical protein